MPRERETINQLVSGETMPAFRKVEPQTAGPSALGILIPPGAKTLVILRPRGLEWDLLPARWSGDAGSAPAFCQFGRDEAALLARRIPLALEEAVQAGRNPFESFGKSRHRDFQIWVRVGDFVWIPCRRQPDNSYVPLIFATKEDAENAARLLMPFLHPAVDAGQEYYFNTQRFV
jgi:hypothetical protein